MVEEEGHQNMLAEEMVIEMPEGSSRASRGREDDSTCSEVQQQTDDLIPTSIRLQEHSHEIVCKYSKEDRDWDQKMKIPDFSFSTRSGIMQRVKAPGRWSKSTKAEATNIDVEEGACNVCHNSDAGPSDLIVFCNGCDVAVHANCYGNPLRHAVPERDWFCAQCHSRSSNSRTCCLCPESDGAMKMMVDGQWAHVSCAIFVPVVFFHKADDREPIDTLHVPSSRFDSTCCVCNSSGGACVDCTEIGCESSFHVSCALKKDLAMEFRNGRGGAIIISFCEVHTAAWDQPQE